MKKILMVCAAVALLGLLSTSCSKGCHCYLRTDVAHLTPVFEDETMNDADCEAQEARMNEEAGFADFYVCK